MYIINIYVFIYWILPHFEKFLPDQSYHKLFCTDVPNKIPVTWRNFCLEFCFLENATFLWDEAFKGDELGAGAAGGTAGSCCILCLLPGRHHSVAVQNRNTKFLGMAKNLQNREDFPLLQADVSWTQIILQFLLFMQIAWN